MSGIAARLETARLDDALSKFCPFRQWQLVNVQFPTAPNTDIDIAHSLKLSRAENVVYIPLQQSSPTTIWHNRNAGATPWSNQVIRLRSTVGGAKALILLATVPERNLPGLPGPSDAIIPGDWNVPPYSAAFFTAPTGGWSVTAANVTNTGYVRIGSTLMVSLLIDNTTVTGTPQYLEYALPAGNVVTFRTDSMCQIINNSVAEVGVLSAQAGDTKVRIYRGGTVLGGNWTGGALTNGVRGQIIIPVTTS
jgi:hypothetical protein